MEDNQEILENETTLSSEEMKLLVVLGRALADPTRIRILGLLAERPMYGQELAKVLDVKPPTISHHIAPLVMAGLVRVRRENNYHYYELDSDGIQHLAESTQHIVSMMKKRSTPFSRRFMMTLPACDASSSINGL